jgi:HK97 gp10 family phage protein
MKTTIKLKGSEALFKKFKAYGEQGEKDFAEQTRNNAENIRALALMKVPIDTTELSNNIFYEEVNRFVYKIFVNLNKAPYAPFVEFGTGGLVDIPKGWERLAATFKGKGIKKVNLPARPYLYPAFRDGSTQYVRDLKSVLKQLSNKFNR